MLDLRAALKQCPIVAILRGVKPDEIDGIGDALIEAGVTVIEVPLNSPQPFDSIKRLAARHGARALVGAGTVLEVGRCRAREGSGRPAHRRAELRCRCRARRQGRRPRRAPRRDDSIRRFRRAESRRGRAEAFPAEIIPPAVFKAWRAVFPAETLMLAVGGVGVDNLKSYAEAGASGYGIGSALYKPGRPAAEIGKLARALVAAAKA